VRWLLFEMWIYLGVAFVLGMLAYRWVFGGGNALSQEDLSAELASVRTRSNERETEYNRLRSRLAEVSSQLDDAKRAARSYEAEARAARNELEDMKVAADTEARAAARREREAPYQGAPASEIPDEPSGELPNEPAPEVPAAGAVETVSFMAALREGAPDDLTKIKGIGQKLESTLNGLGIYFYRQIADWSDGDIEIMNAKLKFPGRIQRDKWRDQARRLLGREA